MLWRCDLFSFFFLSYLKLMCQNFRYHKFFYRISIKNNFCGYLKKNE